MGFYGRAAWRKARAQALHDANWLCTECGVSLVGKGGAAHVHHRKPLEVAPALAFEPQNLRPVCSSCHDRIEPRNGQEPKPRGANLDGSPSDPSHPWYARRQA